MTERESSLGKSILTALVHEEVIPPDVAETIEDAINNAINIAWASTWDDNGASEAEDIFRRVFWENLTNDRT